MTRIPSIMRTFGAYFQQKRKAKLEANKRRKEKKALEKQRKKALNAIITSEHDTEKSKPNTATNEAINSHKKKKKKEKKKIGFWDGKTPLYTSKSSSVHMIYTPMGNKR